MNNEHNSAQGEELRQKLVEHFAAAATAVVSQIAGREMRAEPEIEKSATESATLMLIEISGALAGCCEIALSAAMTREFAALLTGERVDPGSEMGDECREAAAELLQQICGNAADRLRAEFGSLELKTNAAARQDAIGTRYRLKLRNGSTAQELEKTDALEMELHLLRLEAQKKEAPCSAADDAPKRETRPSMGAERDTGGAARAGTEQQLYNRNLDLLLDIELGVSLRFGSRQMLLKDILELSSGSVVELDRRVEEPVDLLIDGRVIARGEVVIIEGNYGLRILQVATQGEKLACLP
jgi:flagellar motor switch protein FliN/FliY